MEEYQGAQEGDIVDEHESNDGSDDGIGSDEGMESVMGGEGAINHPDDDDDDAYHTYPEERETLQRNLKGTYTCPIVAHGGVENSRQLTTSEKISLEHYIAWRKSNGTELAYKLHAQVLQKATQTEVLSLYAVKSLAMKLSRLKALKFDICPNSCMAYTGDRATMTACNFEKKNVICSEPRYNKKGKPRAQMIYVSCLDMIRAMYANAETSTLLRS